MLTGTKRFSVLNVNYDAHRKHHVDDNDIGRILSSFFRSFPYEESKSQSLEDRKSNVVSNNSFEFTYGEIVSIDSMEDSFQIIESVQQFSSQNKLTFCDLGSGIGKYSASIFSINLFHITIILYAYRPLIAAALLRPQIFQLCIGIEILPRLHHIALNVKHKWESANISETRIELKLASFLEDLSWCEGDIIFANSTCFEASTIRKLHEISMERMKKGSFFITLSHSFESVIGKKSCGFRIVGEARHDMSWGQADFFIQQKIC